MNFENRPTFAKINLNNLRFNGKQVLAKTKGKEAMAIIKANAYGHGSVFCARALESIGFKKFGVATFTEGKELREQGMQSELHILNGITGPLPEYFSSRLYPVIYDLEQLKSMQKFLQDENREFSVSLKFDTGMGRLGFNPIQADEIISLLRNAPNLKVASILTHLARADEEKNEHTDRQYTLFKKLKNILMDRGNLKQAKFSICNSAAILDGNLDDFDWVRPGIMLYGCYPNPRHIPMMELKPVLELKSKILSLKHFTPHSFIGYGGTFETKREAQIAVIPIGYADGYPRLASNRGHVLVNGKKAPIVGRVSMDLMTIDVTDIEAVKLHDDVTLIGEEGSEIIRAEDVAKWAETISYEILCGISARVPRIYEGM